MKKINVGIDLGTTYSAVAVFNRQRHEAEVLLNDCGAKYTPSVICIENGVVSIGEDAKKLQSEGNTNTAAFYKSMMGDKEYKVYIDGGEYTSEDLSREYLRVLKRTIEQENNVEIEGAVITVPAYFDEFQRVATRKAGIDAGFNVLKIINEPTSAIIAYGLTGRGKKNVLVYDLGGGTFDVTIASINGTNVDVLATHGNHQLGGKDWDAAIMEELVERFEDEYGINVESYPECYKELQVKCEEAKKKLTQTSSTTVIVQCEGYTGRYPITREFFDEQTSSLLTQTLMIIETTFERASKKTGRPFGWNDIDEVVLVGGSTRMPQVKDMIVRVYGKPPVTKKIDVDTIVAVGAAMQAELCTEGQMAIADAALPGESKSSSGGDSGLIVISASDIQDVTAHALGMLAKSKDGKDYINSEIIPKDSKLGKPFGKQYSFRGDTLEVYVLQGEERDPHEATILYKYIVTGMPSGVKNIINVNFLYNQNGVVDVSATLEDGTSLNVRQTEVTETIDEIIAKLKKEEAEAKKRSNVEVMFVIDISGSMSGTPIIKAKEAISDFVRQTNLSSTKVAILGFATSSKWFCNFTNNASTLNHAISSIIISDECGYGTSYKPLEVHGNSFSWGAGAKVIVVLTDGEWTNQASEIQASQKLKQKGITIYAVGVGDADTAFLDAIASQRGKKVDLSALSTTFKDIATSIATEID